MHSETTLAPRWCARLSASRTSSETRSGCCVGGTTTVLARASGPSPAVQRAEGPHRCARARAVPRRPRTDTRERRTAPSDPVRKRCRQPRTRTLRARHRQRRPRSDGALQRARKSSTPGPGVDRRRSREAWPDSHACCQLCHFSPCAANPMIESWSMTLASTARPVPIVVMASRDHMEVIDPESAPSDRDGRSTPPRNGG